MPRRVALIASGAEGEAAWAWLETLPGLGLSRVEPKVELPLAQLDVLWVHGQVEYSNGLDRLRSWLERGGRLLATLEAGTLPHELGLEPEPPDERRQAIWHQTEDEFWLEEYKSFHAFPHIRGLAGFGPHPLFAGLHQGTYTWAPIEGEAYSWCAYRHRRPARGAVVAVERSFIHLNAHRAVAWEQSVGEGGILCLGAFVSLAAPDPLLRRQLHALLANALMGDAIPHRDRGGVIGCWPNGEPGAKTGEEFAGSPLPVGAIGGPWLDSGSTLRIDSPAASDEPWTLAGRRLLLTGSERHGLREVWAHPFRVVQDARLLIEGRPPEATAFSVSPHGVSRTLAVGPNSVRERWTTALELPVMFWDLDAEGQLGFELEWTTDFRRMWPYPAGVLGKVAVRPGSGEEGWWLSPVHGTAILLIHIQGGRCEPAQDLAESGGCGVRLRIEAKGHLRLALIAASDPADLERSVKVLNRRGFVGLQRQRLAHARQLADQGTTIEAPVGQLVRAFEWAKVRMDGFLADTPGVGRALMAGYAGSRPGWADGRPGYGWYFARDACWTGFAQLAAGQSAAVRDVLTFLAQTQDVSGKVPHEYTTSGLAHYDAADSSPLYLLLAGRYAAWTGDLAFLEKIWDSVESALHFCVTTDTDGDGLIENSRVGHGWIEHGPLGGAHLTSYLAACWIAALEGLEPVARALNRVRLAEELHQRAHAARAAVHARLRIDGEYALGLRADGSAQTDRTAMLAVPILLGVVSPGEAGRWYDEIAGPGFSAPWGVRMVSKDDPLFQPAGYHLGAVWPLYTGWTSLAEWRGARWRPALDHLLANAALVDQRAKGAFDEVLHGLELAGGGVCPDQAWSAAMVVSPVVEGLWGVRPDALSAAVGLAPHLPAGWDGMAMRNLPVGRTRLDLRLRSRPGRILVQIRRASGPRIRIALQLRGLQSVSAVTLDETPLGAERAVFEAEDVHEVAFYGER